MTTYLNIGLTGIRASQMSLLTAEHNIANASTPGFSRQSTFQATGFSLYTGDGALGQGVQIVTIRRNYDQFLGAQLNTAQTKLSELSSLYSSLSQIDNVLADPNAGLAPSLRDFFSGVQQVAANPSLLPARQAMISSAQTLASRFQALDNRLVELSGRTDSRIESAVAEINAWASDIAGLNQSIVIAQAAYGQPANDLLDRRDYMVNELNKLIQVSTATNSDGSMNVSFASGQQLVVGNSASRVLAEPSSADSSRLALKLSSGPSTYELPDRVIVGGELGGLFQFRNGQLESTINALGRIAASVALTFNAQQALGQNLYGAIDGEANFQNEFFSISLSKALGSASNSAGSALEVEFADPIQGTNGFTTGLTGSAYRVVFNAGLPTITRLSDGGAVTSTEAPPGTFSFEGLKITPANVSDGDSFLVRPLAEAAREIRVNPAVVNDPRLIAAASPVRMSQNLDNEGNLALTLAQVSQDYDLNSVLSGSPLSRTLAVTGGELTGLPAQWSARYLDGSTLDETSGSPPPVAGLAEISFGGLTFKLSGAAVDGDQFTLTRNTNGIQDGRNVALMANLQTAKTMADGTATFNSAYSAIVAEVGIQTRETRIRVDSQESLFNQIQMARDSKSGVNLDEEAANLLKFQQAYQASAKALQIGIDLFERILALR